MTANGALEGHANTIFNEHASKTKFRPGQRVRPSKHGIESNIFPKTRHHQTGVVVSVDRWNCPTVRWEGRKGMSSYFSGFIAPDRRKKRL